MVFCGQCGYQLGPGDKVCPRCGTKTDVDLLIENDPGTYNPTEISHAILERYPTQSSSVQNRGNPQTRQIQPEQRGPLVLGPVSPNEQLANETTTMMNSQMYMPQQPYPTYQQPAGTGMYSYPGGYQNFQPGQSAAVAEILEASRKGKITSLLLILFGLLLLIAAIIVFLLNQQGIIFAP